MSSSGGPGDARRRERLAMSEGTSTSARSTQPEVVAFLSQSAAYGGGVDRVDCIETHASFVFLAGPRAFKLKREVRYDYLDFSTVELRRAACHAELALNRRTAPQIYLRVVAVTREPDGSLALGGSGTPVDWLVEMTRFDQDALFDRLAARHALNLSTMPALADAIAALHADAEQRFDRGGRAGMQWVVDGNAEGFATQGQGILDQDACARLIQQTRAALDRGGTLLEDRRERGFVRWCHGDLHLRNIVLLDGRPTLFDGVEFNDLIACVDVQYDLAFLLMDLWQRGLQRHANVVFNEYLARTGDEGALGLMPLWLSCRAAVRAKTNATAARLQKSEAKASELRTQAQAYLALAARLLVPPAARLIAIGGLSGSGKSTLAARVAPRIGAAPGALLVRSDLVRKSMFGVRPLERLGPEAYAPDVNRRVYEQMAGRARAALAAGHSVVVDAVHADPAARAGIEQAARDAGVSFTGLWLEADPDTLAARIRSRQHDVSDATVDVLRRQLQADAGPVAWHRADASGEPEAVEQRAIGVLG
jgi:aminoglycoside phosphotransferase family enzyme/predicted kinase